MGQNTWNFPCWQCRDKGPDFPAQRDQHGNVWYVGAPYGTTQPFSGSITAIFSTLKRSGWTSPNAVTQGIFSVGAQFDALPGFQIDHPGSISALTVAGWDAATSTQRYLIALGDEDGINWFSWDKWYQIGVSMDATGISYCVNGSTTPKTSVVTNAPGALSLDAGSDRIWHTGPGANWSGTINTISTQMPSMVLGAAAYSTTKLDFSDAAVRARIWDSNGDFKNPGENGSLWFGDYNDDNPEYYFVDGTPRQQKGTDVQVWDTDWVGAGNHAGVPGGLKKQYE